MRVCLLSRVFFGLELRQEGSGPGRVYLLRCASSRAQRLRCRLVFLASGRARNNTPALPAARTSFHYSYYSCSDQRCQVDCSFSPFASLRRIFSLVPVFFLAEIFGRCCFNFREEYFLAFIAGSVLFTFESLRIICRGSVAIILVF